MPEACYVLEGPEPVVAIEPVADRLKVLLNEQNWGYVIVLGPDLQKTYDWCCELVDGGKFRVSAVWVKDAGLVRDILKKLVRKPGVKFDCAQTRLYAVDLSGKATKALDDERAASLFRVNGAYLSIFAD